MFICGVSQNSNGETMMKSIDGINWSFITGSANLFSSCYQVATNGKRWVAVGFGSNNYLAYSTDAEGENWVGLGIILFIGNCVIYDGTQFIAGGLFSAISTSFTIATSTDGINWTGRVAFTGTSSVGCLQIAYNPNVGTYVAVGKGNISKQIMYSTDKCVSWNSASIPSGIFFIDGYDVSVNTSSNIWYAVGEYIGSNRLRGYRSTDGINWTLNLSFVSGVNSSTGFRSVHNNGSIWVVGGTYQTLLYSVNDALTWLKIDLDTSSLVNTNIINAFHWNSDFGFWIGTGRSIHQSTLPSSTTSTVMYSPDGIQWAINPSSTLNSVTNAYHITYSPPVKTKLNCCPDKVFYSKKKTGENDPSISKKMRYSEYVRRFRR